MRRSSVVDCAPGDLENGVPEWRGWDDGIEGVLGEASWVGAHGIVGEHGGVTELE